LAIGKKNDYEQGDNGSADRDDVVNAQEAKGNQQAESGFGPVRGGTKGIETKNWNARAGTDLFSSFIDGFERLANYEIENIHGESVRLCLPRVAAR
jgi:hypothetical protein